MIRALVWVLVASACGSSSNDERVPCAGSVELRRWLADLAADGSPGDPFIRNAVTLAMVDEPPRSPPNLVSVTITRCSAPETCSGTVGSIRAQGELIASGDRAIGEATAALTAKLLEVREIPSRPGEEWKVLFLVDGGVSWGEVAAIVGAAQRAEVRSVVFAFDTRAMRASAPLPSSIDGELARRDAEWAARTADGQAPTLGGGTKWPNLADKVYARCPGAQRMLNGLLSETIASDDKIQALVQRVPDEVAACGCKVEIAAAKQLLWRLWDRNRPGALFAWIEVEIAPDGVPLAAAATEPWSRASARVVEAARTRTPIGLP